METCSVVSSRWHVREPEFLESSRETRVSIRACGTVQRCAQASMAKGLHILSKSYGKTDTQLFIQQQAGVRKMSALASDVQVQLLSVPLPPSGATPHQALPVQASFPCHGWSGGAWGALGLSSHSLGPHGPESFAIAPHRVTQPSSLAPRAPQRPESWPWRAVGWAGHVVPWDILPATRALPLASDVLKGLFLSRNSSRYKRYFWSTSETRREE